MKKIFQFVKGVIKFVLGNLDYIAAFTLGALAQIHYPELLNDIYLGLIEFDYAGAWESIKDFGATVYDKVLVGIDWIKAKLA